MSGSDVAAYVFDAEILCPGCAAVAVGWPGDGGHDAAVDYIEKVGIARGIDVHDEHTFDSGEWPKVVLKYQTDGLEDPCDGCHGPLI